MCKHVKPVNLPVMDVRVHLALIEVIASESSSYLTVPSPAKNTS